MFFTVENKKQGIFKKYFLIVLYYFYFFMMTILRNNYITYEMIKNKTLDIKFIFKNIKNMSKIF